MECNFNKQPVPDIADNISNDNGDFQGQITTAYCSALDFGSVSLHFIGNNKKISVRSTIMWMDKSCNNNTDKVVQ